MFTRVYPCEADNEAKPLFAFIWPISVRLLICLLLWDLARAIMDPDPGSLIHPSPQVDIIWSPIVRVPEEREGNMEPAALGSLFDDVPS